MCNGAGKVPHFHFQTDTKAGAKTRTDPGLGFPRVGKTKACLSQGRSTQGQIEELDLPPKDTHIPARQLPHFLLLLVQTLPDHPS